MGGSRYPQRDLVLQVMEVIRVVEIYRDVAFMQAKGCRFCLHIGSVAFLFGNKKEGSGPRLEILTPLRWFRWSSGYGRNITHVK